MHPNVPIAVPSHEFIVPGIDESPIIRVRRAFDVSRKGFTHEKNAKAPD
jgi:hypothetical protein